MVAEAEKYKDEDDKQREKVVARNGLESTVFQYKQAVDGAGDKLTQEDKDAVNGKCREVLSWLDGNNLAEKEEFEQQLQELQKICSPVMTKLHQAGQGAPGQHAQEGQGPTVEEMD